jgi:hypothetical protein
MLPQIIAYIQMVLGCLLFRLFRARLCSFRSSVPLAHSLFFRSPLLAPLASAVPRSLLFLLASARLSALSTRLCFSDACFPTLAFRLTCASSRSPRNKERSRSLFLGPCSPRSRLARSARVPGGVLFMGRVGQLWAAASPCHCMPVPCPCPSPRRPGERN